MSDTHDPNDAPKLQTLCARPAEPAASITPPLVPPLQLSSVYRVGGLDDVDALYEKRAAGFVYARDGNPNSAELAKKLASLEGAEAAVVCASGMAAESATILSLVDGGGHVALSDGLYGKTGTLVKELTRFGVSFSLFDPTRPDTLRAALRSNSRLAFVETLSNPLLRVADLPGLAQVARTADIRLVVDHTFTPLLCRPIELGADIVIHSLTKSIGGHSDLTLGLLAGSRSAVERIAALASTFGLSGNPFESWLALRGLATLGIRSERACANAFVLAERLAQHASVAAVHYPGLPGHPDHERAAKMLKGGFGAIVTIDIGSRAAADTFIRNLRHIPYAPSFGDVSTTLSHPTTTSHRGQSAEQWKQQGITPGLIRLSIGIEDVGDLWDDLLQALERIR